MNKCIELNPKGYEEAVTNAIEHSKFYECCVHINYNAQRNTFYLSDWYDCDSTIATYTNGHKN